MGETRAKKPSQRSLKAQQKANALITSEESRKPQLSVFPSTQASPEPSPTSSSSFTSVSYSLASLESTSYQCGRNDSIAFWDASLIKVTNIEGKGVGVIAARKIVPGTLVLVDPSLIRLTTEEEESSDGNSEELKEQSISTKFLELPKPSQREFKQLFDTNKDGFSKIKSIYYSNCYNLNKPRSVRGGSCVGRLASRINHSCVPNVQFSFVENDNDRNGMIYFYAIKHIPRGAEILSNYESAYRLANSRQSIMRVYYGFDCDCCACIGDAFWAGSDARRLQMIKCKQRIRQSEDGWQMMKAALTQEATANTVMSERNERSVEGCRDWRQGFDAKNEATSAISNLVELEALLRKEGLVGCDLTAVYKDLVKWSRRAGDTVAISKWTKLEHQTCIMVFGDGSRELKELGERLKL